jgi:WD40 repeat protein/transcriptional regulator with XRE-family HTH domain
LLTLRNAIGLTQEGLAQYLGVSRRAIGLWETGESYPKATHLKAFISLAFKHQTFVAGCEAEEIRFLWRASHQKEFLSDDWLAVLLAQKETYPPFPQFEETHSVNAHHELTPPSVITGPRVDWGEALAVPTFYGREWELKMLSEWVVEERCKVVSLLGMGGIGKSTLAVNLMRRIANQFEVVIWRSVRDAPSCEALFSDCLQILAPQALSNNNLAGQLSLLVEQLRSRRVLLVLDNLETLLQEGEGTGVMRPGYEAYGRLLRRIAETEHQSCLLLTSREKPGNLIELEGSRSPVRVLHLARLDTLACEQLLTEKDVGGNGSERAQLIEAYAGNPLALKIVARTIVDLFGGEIASFLGQGEIIFGGVRELLNHQFIRLSELEQTVLFWLAIMREPSTIDELRAMFLRAVPSARLLEAVEGLHRRSLIERGQKRGSFTLQSVVLEYATARLIEEIGEEILQGRLDCLTKYGLSVAGAREYVRQTQERLLVIPILAYVLNAFHEQARVEEELVGLLTRLRKQSENAQGYGPANLVALLRLLRGDLRGFDLSGLVLCKAYLQGVEMQDTTLAGTLIQNSIFTEAFDITWAVAISPDGQYWAAGSRRGEVRVWGEEGKLLHLVWQAHTDTIRALAFNPTGGTLATGSWDGTIKMWDLKNASLLWTNWSTDNIESLAFAPDGQTLASGGDDASIQLWDATSGAHRMTLSGQSGPVFALAWSPDGSLLASGGTGSAIRLWELSGREPETSVWLLEDHTGWVLGLAFAPNGRTLASGSWDATIKLWDVASGSLHQTLTGQTERVRAVKWSPDGQLLASCGFDETIWLWDVKQRSYRTALQGHTAGVYDIAFTPDSHKLISGSEDGTLRVWDTARGQCIQIKQGYAESLYEVGWSPDGSQLASAGSNRLVTIWDVKGLKSPRLLHGHRSLVFGVGWSPDGRLLASSGLDNAIHLWDTTTGEVRQILQDRDRPNTIFYGLAWSPDGTRLATTSYQQGVQIWEVASGRGQWLTHGQPTRIRRIAWSPDGTQLASGGDDGSIYVWHSSAGTMCTSLKGHRGMVMSVAWSPDGTQLASCGGRGRGELFIWDVQSGECLQSWSELNAMVYGLAWHLSGEVLVSGDSAGSIRWWDVQEGKCLMLRQGHQSAIHSLRASPDGLRLASCGDDNMIQVWDIQSGEPLKTLRRDRPYDRLDISGLRGMSEAQKATLRTLGAIEK